MICKLVERSLEAFHDGEAGPLSAWMVRIHLRRCSTCTRHLDDLRRLSTWIARSPLPFCGDAMDVEAMVERGWLYEAAKRWLDISLGLLLLVFYSPLIVRAAWRIRRDGGPILCQHMRLGKGGRPFVAYRFRTTNDGDTVLTMHDELRMTPIGYVLRYTRTDYLPQLFNVIRGDMSLVGPQAQLARHVMQFGYEQYTSILMVRPGLVGPTQLRYMADNGIPDGVVDPERYYLDHILPRKWETDTRYVRERCLTSDIRLMWRAFWAFTGGFIKRYRCAKKRKPIAWARLMEPCETETVTLTLSHGLNTHTPTKAG